MQTILSTCMDLLMSEDHSTPELQPAIGRLVNAMVAVLGPELSAGSRVFSRCQSIVADMSTAEEPTAQLECVLYAQQLVLFAPQAVLAHNHVETLRATLSSRQVSSWLEFVVRQREDESQRRLDSACVGLLPSALHVLSIARGWRVRR